ncbi:MAG: ECF transporter S component [Ruminococcaceae bacterium]|nr:ECF transporter S component [Oscillospiraceae bacterium]
MKNNFYAKKITRIAVLVAISVLLQHLVPYKVAGFLDIELSDFPAIIGSLAMGPVEGVLIELLKNIFHLPVSGTGFVGEFANFVVNGTFVFVIGIVYRFMKTKKGALLSLILGTIVMTLAAILTNRYIMLPMYMEDAPVSVYWNMIFVFITPFNFARGIVLSLLTFFSYKKLRTLL